MFKDGWVPPEVIAGKDVSNLSAAIAANAAAVAQFYDEHRKVGLVTVNIERKERLPISCCESGWFSNICRITKCLRFLESGILRQNLRHKFPNNDN